MEAWIVWWATLLAVVYVVSEASLTALPRITLGAFNDWIVTFLYCRMCVAFWVGLALGAAGLFPAGGALASGVVALGLMWFVQGHMSRNITFEDELEAIAQVRAEARLRREQAKKEKDQ